jgi:hypothetical protein
MFVGPKRRACDGRGHGDEPLVLQIRDATPPRDDARWTDDWFTPWHGLHRLPGVVMAVDEFQAELDGLTMAQAELETPAAFPMPDFAAREVTDGPRFGSAYLVSNGLPTGYHGCRYRGAGPSKVISPLGRGQTGGKICAMNREPRPPFVEETPC